MHAGAHQVLARLEFDEEELGSTPRKGERIGFARSVSSARIVDQRAITLP
jgi:hypothetical protein